MSSTGVVLAAALSIQLAAVAGRGSGVSGLTVTRLEGVAPSQSRGGGEEIRSHGISASPIVLWSREGAPAVLYVERSAHGVYMVGGVAKTKIGVLSGGARKLGGFGSPYPITERVTQVAGGKEPDFLSQAWPVDLDGDGHDELVTLTWYGRVEVYDAKRRVARWESKDGRVQVHSVQAATIGGKGQLLVSLSRLHTERGEDGDERRPDPYVLLRVDASGVHPIALRDLGFEIGELLGAGFVSQPGAPDELVVAVEKRKRDEGAVYYSRHSLDGRILGPPRRAQGAGFYGHTFEHLPGSDTTVDWYVQDRQLYVVTPGRERDWFRHLDLDRHCKDGRQAEYLGVMDRESAPKIVWSCDDDLFAADLEGRPLALDGKGWHVADGFAPFLRSAPPMEGQSLTGVLFDGDTTLLVWSRGRTMRKVADDEAYGAALRFLPLRELEFEQRVNKLELEESSEPWDSTRRAVEEEREKRKIQAPIHTVDDWKRLMPDHYEATRREKEGHLRHSLTFNVTYPLSHQRDLAKEGFRELEAYRQWLGRLDLAAQTTFVVLRGGRKLGEFSVRGAEARLQDDERIAPSISFRARAGGVAIVMALDEGNAYGDDPPPLPDPVVPGFYLIEWTAARDGAQ